VFDLAHSVLVDAVTAPAGLASPKTDGLSVTDWQNIITPHVGTKLIALEPNERSRSLAVRPDNAGFVLGRNSNALLRCQRSGALGSGRRRSILGREPRARRPTGAGRLGDGTIRWYRWSDGKELLALFVDSESKAWVAWTPQGYYRPRRAARS